MANAKSERAQFGRARRNRNVRIVERPKPARRSRSKSVSEFANGAGAMPVIRGGYYSRPGVGSWTAVTCEQPSSGAPKVTSRGNKGDRLSMGWLDDSALIAKGEADRSYYLVVEYTQGPDGLEGIEYDTRELSATDTDNSESEDLREQGLQRLWAAAARVLDSRKDED